MQLLGKQGGALHDYATGREHAPVIPRRDLPPPKSVGSGVTFPHDLVGWEELRSGAAMLADHVASRLREAGMKCTTVQVTIRDPSFRDICRQKRLDAPTYVSRDILDASFSLIRGAWNPVAPVRALTVTAQALLPEGEAAEQLDLFAAGAAQKRDKREHLERAVDQMRKKYGYDAISPASTLTPEQKD